MVLRYYGSPDHMEQITSSSISRLLHAALGPTVPHGLALQVARTANYKQGTITSSRPSVSAAESALETLVRSLAGTEGLKDRTLDVLALAAPFKHHARYWLEELRKSGLPDDTVTAAMLGAFLCGAAVLLDARFGETGKQEE